MRPYDFTADEVVFLIHNEQSAQINVGPYAGVRERGGDLRLQAVENFDLHLADLFLLAHVLQSTERKQNVKW